MNVFRQKNSWGKFFLIPFILFGGVISQLSQSADLNRYSDTITVDRAVSDSFPEFSLTELVNVNRDDFVGPVDGHDNDCDEVLGAVFDGNVSYIKPEWDITDYSDSRMDEFKVCETFERAKEIRLKSNIKNWEDIGYDVFHLERQSKESEKNTIYRKYKTFFENKEYIWLEIIETPLALPGSTTVFNVLPDHCLIDSLYSTRFSESSIYWSGNGNTPLITLAKSCFFQF